MMVTSAFPASSPQRTEGRVIEIAVAVEFAENLVVLAVAVLARSPPIPTSPPENMLARSESVPTCREILPPLHSHHAAVLGLVSHMFLPSFQ